MPKKKAQRSHKLSKEQRVNKTVEAAARQEVAALAAKVDLISLEAAPADEQGTRDWEEAHDQVIDARNDADALAKKYHSRANSIRGKPLSASEKAEHAKLVKRHVRNDLRQQLASWEDTLDTHESNVEVGFGLKAEEESNIEKLRAKIEAAEEVLAEVRAELGVDDEEPEPPPEEAPAEDGPGS